MSSLDAFDGTAVSRRDDTLVDSRSRLISPNEQPPSLSTRSIQDQSGLPLGGPLHEFVLSPAFSGWQGKAKRAFDIVGAVIGLFLLGPLLVLVALAIAIESRGPVIFAQLREGQHGIPFRALKFRSMRMDSCDKSGVRQTVPGDTRLTRLGGMLRKTSIDELPQLFNVLTGEMSLVGPRPHVSSMLAGGMPYRELVPYYDLRLLVRPGLTGWAQANGFRGPTSDGRSAQKRIDHDLAYVQNFSMGLDIKIILLTLRHEFFGGTGH